MMNFDYGIIGNCSSAALISKTGAIEWLCLPVFDSASVFAKILDKQKGGSFEIITGDDYYCSQQYMSNTNILVTTFTNGQDKFEVVDFMPRYHYHNGREHIYSPPDLIRYIRVKSGNPEFRVKYDPKLEYAERPTVTEIRKDFLKSYTMNGTYDSLYLYTNVDKEDILNGLHN